jgi:GntR family transcriptional regulator, rspAB operon transcriptional repressor
LAMRRIAEAVESTRAQVERTRRLMLPAPGRTPDTYREHRAIVTALKTRDSHKAATAMARHLDAVMMELKKFAARHPNLFEP